MDVRRSCCIHRCYWDDAQTLASDIIWYFVPDDRPFFPGEQIFTSEIWDPVHWFTPGAGEDPLSPPRYYNGAAPGPFKGNGHVCGNRDWFGTGCPSDAPPIPRRADGLPACCFGRGAYSTAYSDAFDTFRSSS